ncbi:MAG: lysophospholipid acyltransferase family protein [Thermomicrobiales bacterium]
MTTLSTTTSSNFGDLRDGTLQGWKFKAVQRIFRISLRLALGYRVHGQALVPTDSPFLLVANHLHNLDPVLAAISCPRSAHFMAKRELFSIPVIGSAIRLVGAFPVDRGRADRSAIRRARATLDQGIALGMFPEGTRSKTGGLKHGLPGAGLIAIQSGVPIIPMAITGSDRLPGNGAWNKRGRFRRGVDVRMGTPFHLEPPADGSRLTADAATDQIMRSLAALLPEDYRGMYGDERPGDPADAAASS